MKPLTPTTPHVIIMVGIPGAGKTHFADHFAKMFHAPFINQYELQTITGASDAQATELSAKLLTEFLKTGRTVIYEGPTHARTFRQALVSKIKKAGYDPLIVWVQTESVEAKNRYFKSNKNASPEYFQKALQRFSRPIESEKSIVISGRHTYGTQVKAVLKRLADTRDVTPPQAPERPQRSTGRSIKIR